MVEKQQHTFFYGYLIVVLGFWTIVLGTVGNITFGVFFEPLLTEFGWTRAMTSVAMAISGFIAGMFNVVTGRLTDRFGPRVVMTIAGCFSGLGLLLLSQINTLWQLYACFGIIAIGGSGFLVPVVSTVARWFVKRRGMMTSIIISALGTGEMIMPPLARWLISSYGWRTSYMILGISVIVIITLAAQFIRRDPGQVGLAPYGAGEAQRYNSKLQTTGHTLREAMATREFWIFGSILVCYFIAQSFVSTHIVIYSTGIGISRISAANVFIIIGSMYIISINVSGNVADRTRKQSIVAVGFILQSAALFGFLLVNDVWILYLCAVILGLGRGVAMAPMPLLIAEIFGLRSYGAIQGAIFFGATAGQIVGPTLTGYIFDITGSYFIALLSCGSIVIIGFLLTFFIRTNADKPV